MCAAVSEVTLGSDCFGRSHVFDCYCQGSISGGETWCWAMSPPKFEICLMYPYFLGP